MGCNGGKFWKSFVSRGLTSSFFMILATELGDETFIIAAVMSMRHPKFVVFLGGFVVGVSADSTPWHPDGV